MTEATFATRDGAIPVAAMLADVLAMIAADAEALGCMDDVHHCREIVGDGSSADAQLRRFAAAGGADARGSLGAVLQWIAGASIDEVTLRDRLESQPAFHVA